MSVRCEGCGLEYAGGRGLRGVFAQPRRLIDPRFLRMLWQVKRFHRRALAFLRTTDDENLTTYGEFLEREGFSGYFIAPLRRSGRLVRVVRRAEPTLAYPARYLFRFLDHHGMLRVDGSPQWYTVAGGSRIYVERLAALLPDVRAAHARHRRHPARGRRRDPRRRRAGRPAFDRVVIATHADQALGLLTDPTPTRGQHPQGVQLLAQRHRAAHRPLGPARRRAGPGLLELPDDVLRPPGQPAVVTYWMNRLQGHRAAQEFLVTLNDRERLDPESIVATMDYEHPIYTPEAVARAVTAERPGHRPHRVRRRLPRVGIPRGRLPLRRRGGTALRSDLVSSASLTPASAPARPQLPPLPALVVGQVTHRRTGPVRHAFRHRRLPVAGRPGLPPPPALAPAGVRALQQR